jgi:hypothetical protein
MLPMQSLLSMKNLWARPPVLDIRASGVTPHPHGASHRQPLTSLITA